MLPVAVFYFAFGVCFAIPYCLLAGWSYGAFFAVAFIAPAFVAFWIMVGLFAGMLCSRYAVRAPHSHWRTAFSEESRCSVPGARLFFVLLTAFGLLPIVFHFLSFVLGALGYEAISSALYAYRYTSFLFAVSLAVVLFWLILIAGVMAETLKNHLMKLVYR